MDMEVGLGTLLPMEVLGSQVVMIHYDCCGAVLGSTIRGTAARPPATGSRATTGAATSVFVLFALPRGL